MTELSTQTKGRVLRLSAACSLAEVPHVAQAAHRFLAEEGCAETEIMDCEIALVEACNNAVQYAAATARGLPLGLEISCRKTEIELRVTDHTPGFDWPKAATLPDSDREHGRGLYLISSLMDEAQYLRKRGENVLVLRRRRER